MNIHNIAKMGYEAYSKSTDNKNFQGNEMPKWEDLPEKIQKAWEAATDEILNIAVKVATA